MGHFRPDTRNVAIHHRLTTSYLPPKRVILSSRILYKFDLHKGRVHSGMVENGGVAVEGMITAWDGHAAGRRGMTGISRAETQLVRLLREKYKLTKKESEIAVRLIQNQRQAAIVEALNISPNTFKTHRRRIYEKLGAARQIDLVAEGHRLWDQARRSYEQS